MAAISKKVPLSRDDTERFINYYVSHECLWNVSSKMYSKREARQAAYSSIAALMGNMTAEHVPAKISTLRTYYCKELRKETISIKSGAGRDDIYVSTWEWFKLLDPFLRNQVHQKSTVDNLIVDGDRDLSEEMAEAENLGCTPILSISEQEINCVVPSTSTDVIQVSSTPPTKKFRKDNCVQSQLLQTLQSIEQRRSDREVDSSLLFGKYVSSEILKVKDLRKQQELKIKIQQLIFEYQFDL